MTQERFDRKYHRGYYERNVSRRASASAPEMAAGIMDLFAPESLVDIGCGAGDLIAYLHDHYGVRVAGLERAAAAIEMAREKNLEVRQFDIETQVTPAYTGADVAVCMEVAEHVSGEASDFLVRLICDISEQILFTAAPPGQPGNGHINCQPREFWIKLFDRHGRIYDNYATRKLSQTWSKSGRVTSWYWRNLMIFRKLEGENLHTAARMRTICEVLREIHDVHPDKATRALVVEAGNMAKKMARKLVQYNKKEFPQWWEVNGDFEEDLRRRTGGVE